MRPIVSFYRAMRKRMEQNARDRRNYRAMVQLQDDILKDIGYRREDLKRFL